jgi:Skp family chaperone for outer membrane proteins
LFRLQSFKNSERFFDTHNTSDQGDTMTIRYTLLVACVGASLLLAACGRDDGTTPEQTGQSTAPAGAQQTTQTAQPTGAEAEDKLIGEVEALQAKVDALQEKAADKTQQTTESVIQELNALKEQKEALKKKADELSATGAQALSGVLTSLDESLNILTRSVEMDTSEDTPGATEPSGEQN